MVSKIRARLILDSDLEALTELLAKGFRRRSRQYWLSALTRLAARSAPANFPKYGYLIESDGSPVGVILLIFSDLPTKDGSKTRCNVSSWYVEPAYRSYASLLISKALRDASVTYFNISPASHVQRIIEAQGFTCYSAGQFVSFPARLGLWNREHGTVLQAGTDKDLSCDPLERQLLMQHMAYGCVSLWYKIEEQAYPFVFLPRLVKGRIPCVQLIYARDVEHFVRFSRSLGRFLLLRGWPLVIIDSNGPIPGLLGKYFDGTSPKYFKGPDRPRLGDLAYTEAAMFGI